MIPTIVLSGYTATGKDLAIKYISNKYNIPIAVSYTTRPKRPLETEGVEYHFISYEEFNSMEFSIPPRIYNVISNGQKDNWYYGTNPDIKSKIVILDRGGSEQLIQALGRENVVTIYIESHKTKLLKRLQFRRDEEAEVIRRIEDDKIKFKGFTPDYKIQNNSSLEDFHYKLDMVMENVLKGGINEII